MPLIIPLFPGEPLYEERVRLEGRDYVFLFDWHDRSQRYYMSIQDLEGNPLISGVRVLANVGLITRKHFNPNLPPGELFAIDQEQGGVPPSLYDFGTRVKLFYFESTEELSIYAP